MRAAGCPKCGFAVGGEAECPRCGVVLARFRSAGAPRRRPTPPPAAPLARPPRRAALPLTAAALLIAFAAAGYALRSAETAPPAVVATAPAPAPDGAEPERPAAELPPPVTAPAPLLATPAPAPAVSVACPVETAPASGVPGRWPVSSAWHRGASGRELALREQDRSQAPLLVYFYTDWCGYCRALDKGLLSERSVDSYLRQNVVKLRVNPEASPRDDALAKSFGVTGYPALFLESGETRVRVSIYAAGGGNELLAPEAFVGAFQGAVARRGVQLRLDGRRALESADARRAVELLDAALAVKPEAEAYLERGRAWLARGDEGRALSDLRASADRDARSPEPYRVAAEHLAALQRWDESVACWSQAIARRPSPESHLARARAHAGRGDRGRSIDDATLACRAGSAEGCALVQAGRDATAAVSGGGRGE